MTDTERLLKAVVDDLGTIRSIAVDDTDAVAMSILGINFERGELIITAIAEDDSIAISESLPQDVRLESVSDVEPWCSLIGGRALWVWMLTNQQGYTDGVQLMLGRRVVR